MAGGFPSKAGKPVTEKKKRKRPSKKVPTTVLESSSTNFMDLVQKLTGSAAELEDGEKRAKAPAVHAPAVDTSSYFHNYKLHNTNSNTIATSYNKSTTTTTTDNDSTSSSSHSGACAPAYDGSFMAAMDPTSSGWNSAFTALGEDDDLYSSEYSYAAGDGSNSTSTSSAAAAAWRDPAGHSEYWYHHHMDAMRA